MFIGNEKNKQGIKEKLHNPRAHSISGIFGNLVANGDNCARKHIEHFVSTHVSWPVVIDYSPQQVCNVKLGNFETLNHISNLFYGVRRLLSTEMLIARCIAELLVSCRRHLMILHFHQPTTQAPLRHLNPRLWIWPRTLSSTTWQLTVSTPQNAKSFYKMFAVVVGKVCAWMIHDNVQDYIDFIDFIDEFELFDLKIVEIKWILDKVSGPDSVSQPGDSVVSMATGT